MRILRYSLASIAAGGMALTGGLALANATPAAEQVSAAVVSEHAEGFGGGLGPGHWRAGLTDEQKSCMADSRPDRPTTKPEHNHAERPTKDQMGGQREARRAAAEACGITSLR